MNHEKSLISVQNFFKNGLKEMSALYTMLHLRIKLRKILKRVKKADLNKIQKVEIKNYYAKYGIGINNLGWHQFYTGVSGNYFKEYIPEDLFFARIEPALNRKTMCDALLDKNLLETLFPEVKQPETIVKNINGYYYSNTNHLISIEEAVDTCANYKKLVFKPSIESGGGKNVELLNNKEIELKIEKLSINKMFARYKKDFIVQKPVIQHPQMACLNQSSLNTLRVFTYLRHNDTVLLSSTIRVGSIDAFTDNVTGGGGSWGIESNGYVKYEGYDNDFNLITETSYGCKLEGFQIPLYHDIIETTKRLHKKVPNFKLVSWDIAIDDDSKIVLIEYNTYWQEINAHQLMNGPIFGKYTDEILSLLKK